MDGSHHVFNGKVEKQIYFYGSTIVPYLISRLGRKKDVSHDEIFEQESSPSAFVNADIKFVLNLEDLLIPLRGLPFGSSLFARIRKVS